MLLSLGPLQQVPWLAAIMAHTDELLQIPKSKSVQILLRTYVGAKRQLTRIRAPCSWVQVQMQEREKRLEREAAEVDLMCKRLECHV